MNPGVEPQTTFLYIYLCVRERSCMTFHIRAGQSFAQTSQHATSLFVNFQFLLTHHQVGPTSHVI
jgi:hypothetical protein